MKNTLSDRTVFDAEEEELIEQTVEEVTPPPKRNKGGRPRTVNGKYKHPSEYELAVFIDKALFEQASKVYATAKEIAAACGCSECTLRKWCKKTYGKNTAAVLQDLRKEANIRLRRILWTHAEKNPGVAIFLAKNYLGMSDNPVPVDTGERQNELAAALRSASRTISSAKERDLYESIPDADFTEADEESDET